MPTAIQFFAATTAIALSGGVAVAARADCKPVIEAYAKAAATKRYALYDVTSFQQPIKGKPYSVVIGDTGYADYNSDGTYHVIPGGKAALEGPVLKEDEQKGKTRCEPLGSRNIGTDTAIGYDVRSNGNSRLADATAVHMWISKATGLPVFNGVGSDDTGFRWVYGATVVAPATIAK